MKTRHVLGLSGLLLGLLLFATVGNAAEWGLKAGTPDIKSAGPLAFGPDGILLVGDTKSATVFAIDTEDASGNPLKVDLNIKGITARIAKILGGDGSSITINDLAVNPQSGNVYLSIANGTTPAIVRVDAAGGVSEVSLKKVAFSKSVLPNAPEDRVTGEGRRSRNNRDASITDLAFVDGKVLVSGLSNTASPSTAREINFPFLDADPGASLEIYHGAHGKYEDDAVIRTFVPFTIDGEPILLAGFQCTPLVKFPIKGLKSGEKVRGTTLAELGNRNRPLDMIVYKKDGKDYLLMANDRRGVMKISTDDLGRKEGITEKIGGTAGQSYETIADLENVVQLDRLNDSNAIVLIQPEGGAADLKTIALP